jgi:hypothetical protein
MPCRSPDQRAVTPQGRGRFPGYDVLEEAYRWDDVTAGVVLARLAPITDLSFFTMQENAVATALCDLLLAQDSDPRIPVVALIDNRLAVGETDGWHYDDLPEDGQAWRDTLRYLDEDATDRHGAGFAALTASQQAGLIQQVQDLSTRSARWHGLPAVQVWSLWTRYACTAFYSHPWAWNEIGFGGPAYPRGYKNRHADGREPWEVADHDDADPVTFTRRVDHAHHTKSLLMAGDEDQQT